MSDSDGQYDRNDEYMNVIYLTLAWKIFAEKIHLIFIFIFPEYITYQT